MAVFAFLFAACLAAVLVLLGLLYENSLMLDMWKEVAARERELAAAAREELRGAENLSNARVAALQEELQEKAQQLAAARALAAEKDKVAAFHAKWARAFRLRVAEFERLGRRVVVPEDGPARQRPPAPESREQSG